MDGRSEMQPARAGAIRLTYADYLGFPDDGRRHELVDGEHVVTPAPNLRHQRISGRLFESMSACARTSQLGEVFYAPVDVVLSDHDVVQPDLLYVSNDRGHILGEAIAGAPDLVVEILSASTARIDEVTKLGLYDRFDVREYWVVAPGVESVKVYRRMADGCFALAAELTAGRDDRLATPLLPGFSIALRDLFE
jgi:Uma2 family endonuclease